MARPELQHNYFRMRHNYSSSRGPRIGAHVSVAGGAHLAFHRAEEIGCQTMQIFVKNANRWQQRPLRDEEIVDYRRARESSSVCPVLAHSSYLINLANDEESLREKSIAALGDELDRCQLLGVEGLVLHPGSHLGRGVEAGLEAVACGLDGVLSERPDATPRVLLENTAGQGNTLGRSLEELQLIRRLSRYPERIGVCIDTCHAFVAGYSIHTDWGYDEFFARVLEWFPPPVLSCFHLNDSKGDFDSKLDRHENLGRGRIGEGLFRKMVTDERLAEVPMVVETPKGGRDRSGHRADLDLLAKWRDAD